MHITIVLTESLISSLTSAYPPSLLQVSLWILQHRVHQGQPAKQDS